MFRLSSARQAATVTSQRVLTPASTLATKSVAPAALFFADRAVKSTHTSPTFLCTRYALVSGCQRGSAAVALRQAHARGFAALPERARQGPPTRLMADVRVKGCGGVAVFRHGQLRFLCQGDHTAQYHSLTLYDQDVFVLLSSLSPRARLDVAADALRDALRFDKTDMEYVAEEALLTFSDRIGSEGNLCVVGKAASCAGCAAVPPLSSPMSDDMQTL